MDRSSHSAEGEGKKATDSGGRGEVEGLGISEGVDGRPQQPVPPSLEPEEGKDHDIDK